MKCFNSSRVLVTGHTGFKGVWLCGLLKQLGADILGYSDQVSPTSFHNKVNFVNHEVFGDIRNLSLLRSTIQNYKPHYIFHLAAQPLVLDGYKDPSYTFEVNAMGTANILEIARTLDLKVIIICITTDKVYKNSEIRQKRYVETDSLWGVDPYSASKVCAELIAHSYHKSFYEHGAKQKLAIARAGNVIGGGDYSENRLIPDIIGAVSSKRKLKVRSLNATRPWQHVIEPIWGYCKLAELLKTKSETLPLAWNFGPDECNVATVSEIIDHFVDREYLNASEVIESRVKEVEANYLDLDSALALKKLKWKQKWNLDKSIQKIIEWQEYVTKTDDFQSITEKQILEYLRQ